ncbi:hypothetical protein SOVF_029860 [Spinacia oleracea]|uniref:Uncharacterized protein n=1 Tax=Spinacia oleracea TaxID=3562 RepID=A0A9R0I670_SPIOL|nr:uncharacterized protein LOC110782981 [Spinacia oleracea]KNA22878.1 hypothetical protein SOVF_029860 [Spinacia oleracea]
MFVRNSNWGFLWSLIVHAFGFIFRYFLRFFDVKSVGNVLILDDFGAKSDMGIVENCEKMGFEQISEEIEVPKLESEVGNVCNSSTSKYQFITGNSVCAYIEEPQIMNFTVQQMFVISHDESHSSPLRQESLDKDDSSFDVDFRGFSVDFDDNIISHDLGVVNFCSFEHDDCGELSEEEEEEVVEKGETECSVLIQGKTEGSVCDLSYEEQKLLSFDHDEIIEKEEIDVEKMDKIVEKNEIFDEIRPSVSDSDDFWASIYTYDGFLGSSNEKFDSEFDDLLFDKSSIEALDPATPIGIGDIRVDYDQDSPSSTDDFKIDHANSELLDDVDIGIEHEGVESSYIELDLQSYCSSNNVKEQVAKDDEYSDSEDDEFDEERLNLNDLKELDGTKNCEVDEQMGTDVLLEQKELIRQMKKEMRQLKISGLPTILEESESPRVEEDLRPLRIDERIGHKDRMDEIQTFYRRYLDKMRKLDILSQQTMYSIGLLQLKNQDLALNKKVSVPVVKSLLAQNFWSNKLRKHDPVQKLIRDLQRDLELVYVGQLCLSWEMLKWQHHKAEELQAHDPDGFRQHNQVAGEYQKFQVLLQRFTEDEPFHQGPRVQHFVKSRCSLPSLLQVPLIKDDPKSEWRRNGECGISVKMLKDTIGTSMNVFWDFLHADKDEVCASAITLMGIHGVQVILQDPSDADLLTEIRSSLQKKEKRLKDLVRSGNCLVKKFKKHQDQRLSHETLVAQVELRLVSRVLSMPKLSSDQLLWCHKKLNKIDIIGRKIYLEHSFLLFPC